MEYAVKIAIALWIVSLGWVFWKFNRRWPEFEQHLIDTDEFFNAIGQVPSFMKWTCLAFMLVIAPWLALMDVSHCFDKEKDDDDDDLEGEGTEDVGRHDDGRD